MAPYGWVLGSQGGEGAGESLQSEEVPDFVGGAAWSEKAGEGEGPYLVYDWI